MSPTKIFLQFFFLKLLFVFSDAGSNPGEFVFYGFLKLQGGVAELNSDGLINSTISSSQKEGQFTYHAPLPFKNSTNGRVFSFSTTFTFAVVLQHPELSSHRLRFAILPSKSMAGALSHKHLAHLDAAKAGNGSHHIVAVEMDSFPAFQYTGLNINGMASVPCAPAGFYNDQDGNFSELTFRNGELIQVWVEYDGFDTQISVTMHPINIPRPKRPLIFLKRDLSPFIDEVMYVGFSSSSSLISSSHYILGWSFKMNGQVQEIHSSPLPDDAWKIAEGKEGYGKMQRMLAVILSLTGGSFILILIFGALLISKRRKYIRVIEDWEMLYGPHRFRYKDLFIATRGFKDILGKGGFGRVYLGTLPLSKVQIAVKRISHDSKQGMREFVAEIATIGRLRHPNLVRLLGYCRHKKELFLIYDYMPNGSLDKFLYVQHKCVLNWTHRFKIIKDVASALFYLHQQWVQVIIHRDIKPGNVLIDEDMTARLGDFGLAKWCDHGNDPLPSHVAGTLGYIAPELAQRGKANVGTDIFAFGVFMLEVACGRKPVEPRASPDEVLLVDWVLDCWDRGVILQTVDHRLRNDYVVHEVELVLQLGLLCSHFSPAARPSMSSVVQFLDGAAQLPDNLKAIIKSRDFGDWVGEKDAKRYVSPEGISVHSITLTESFASHGR